MKQDLPEIPGKCRVVQVGMLFLLGCNANSLFGGGLWMGGAIEGHELSGFI